MKKVDASIIGNLVIDRIFVEEDLVYTSPGGTAFYGGMALAKLGADVSLVSKIGSDYPEHFSDILNEAGIDLRSVTHSASGPSTSFLWHYSHNLVNREGRISCRGPAIKPEDIPRNINNSGYVQLGIVAGELDPQVLSSLDFDTIHTIAADMHFIRVFSEDGRITLGQGDRFRPFLQMVRVVKGSFEEIASFACTDDMRQALRKIASMGPRILLASNGARGSILLAGGEFFEIPAFRVKEVDATGAGDVFLSTFLFFYCLRGEDPITSAYLASAAASFAVEGSGVSCLGGEKEIRERAELLRRPC